MDLQDIKNKQHELNEAIAKLVDEFQKETRLIVKSIDIIQEASYSLPNYAVGYSGGVYCEAKSVVVI